MIINQALHGHSLVLNLLQNCINRITVLAWSSRIPYVLEGDFRWIIRASHPFYRISILQNMSETKLFKILGLLLTGRLFHYVRLPKGMMIYFPFVSSQHDTRMTDRKVLCDPFR